MKFIIVAGAFAWSCLVAFSAERAVAEGRSVACSPDGKRIAFERDVGMRRKIGILDLASGKVTWPALGDGTACHPSFGPKGEMYYAYNGNTNTNFEILNGKYREKDWLNVYRWRDGKVEQLTHGNHFDMTPSVSPDGNTLYFASTREEKRNRHTNSIFALDLTDPDAKPTLAINGSINYCSGVTDPVVSPDGKTIAWAEYSGWTPPYLILKASVADLPIADPKALKPVTDDNREFAFAPRFDPSGRYLCFSATSRNEAWGVFVQDLVTGERRRVANGKEAAFSPNGRLYYERGGTICELDWRRAFAFEKIALVDSFDFARICDIERKKGCDFILDHVRRTGATALAWRQQTGGRPRYRSECEGTPTAELGVSRLRIPESREGYCWLNLERGETDLMAYELAITADDGRVPAVHLTLEENHYFSTSFSTWVLEHPEYWCVMASGLPWPGHAAFSFPEGIAHKVRLLEELIARGAKLVYIGLDRLGGYGPRFEYTVPSVARWRKLHDTEPPKNFKNPEWVEHCGYYLEEAVRALARTCRKHGVRVILGTRTVGYDSDDLVTENGFDWRRICADGEVDGVCLEYVDPKDAAVKDLNVWEAIDRIYAKRAKEAGRADVYFSCNAYDGPSGIPDLAKATGLAKGECAKKLLELAKKNGGKGVILEVVDYRNYPDDVCKALRDE